MKRTRIFMAFILILLSLALVGIALAADTRDEPQPTVGGGISTGTAPTGSDLLVDPEKNKPEEPQSAPILLKAGIEGVSTDYGWSQSTGTYTEITGGTQLTTSCDDTSYNANAIPFTFTFNGTAYTQFSLNCNGFIAMGASVVSSYTPISSGTSNNVIVGLGGDQQTNLTDSEIRYETLGTTPNQVLVIQWKNFRHYGATGDIYNYQIRLWESSNLVEVVYGPFTQNATNRTSQIGLRGASNADFNNRSGTGSWLSSVTGTINTASMALTSVYYPSSGLTWLWTPIPPHPIFDTSYKTAPAQADVGDPLTYVVHIINSGTATANTATMVDPLPAGTTYIGDMTCSSGTCSYNAGLNQIEWAGSVGVASEVTVDFSVDTDGLPCGSVIVNQATLNDPDLFGGPVVKSASTTLVSTTPTPLEGFEVSVPPAGWTETIVFDPGTDPDWTRESVGTYPTILPHGGAYMAKFNSFSTGSGGAARLWTPALDLSGYSAPQVVFWMSHDTGYTTNADRIQIQVSTDGVTWVDVGAPVQRYDASCTTACWHEHAIPLPSGYNINGVYIGFLGISAYGNNIFLDDTALSEGWYPCPYVSLEPDASRNSCPASSVEYPLTLVNMTPAGDTFDITVTGNNWPTSVDPTQLSLSAGGVGGTLATVTVPWLGGTDTAIVTALGQSFGGTDSATLVTTGASTFWEQIATEPDNGRMDNVSAAWGGYVWSITGYGANRDVRYYDPATDTWTIVGTPPTFLGNYARSGCQAGSKVYMYGDTSTAGFTGLWSYDMATTTWLQETPTGTPPPYTGIWAPAWAYDAETGYCYLTGGATVAGAGTLTSAYVYDPATNAWLTELPPFTSVRDFHAAWVFNDNTARHLLCVAGGNNAAGMTSTQCYDFVAGTWGAENADMGALPADLWGMGYTQKVHAGATQLWVTGGVRAGFLTAQTSFFDTSTGVWVDDGNLEAGAVYRTSATALNNELYAVGGSIGSFTYTGLANHHVQCSAVAPDIEVTPLSLFSSQVPDIQVTLPLSICNVGNAPLEWSISETAGMLNRAPVAAQWNNSPQDDLPEGTPQSLTEFLDSGLPMPAISPVQGIVTDIVPEALTFYSTRGEFDTAYPGLPIEDYENGSMAFGTIAAIPHPLDQFSSNLYFDPGDILPGIQFWASLTYAGDEIAVLGEQFLGNPTKTAVANYFTDSYIIEFDPPVQAAGMDLQDYAGTGTCQIDIYDTNGFLATISSACDAVGIFWGVASDADPITAVVITDLGGGAEGADNVAFGSGAPVDVPWLSEAPITGTVPMGECQIVDVTFDSTGLANGDYFAGLDIDSDDPDEPLTSVPVQLEVYAEPDIQINAPPMDSVQLPDTQNIIPFEICNVGDGILDWNIAEVEGTLATVVPQAILWDNGPLVTHPGGGYNGEDASVLQTALGLNTYGFGNQYINGYRMADDFVVDGTGWQVDQVTFFAYQTGTYAYPPVPTITGLYFQIWDGSPDDPGSSVVFGDLTTNRLASTTWPGMYRVLDTDMLITQRPPMANVATAGVFLPPGTYWLDWVTDGSLSSGPWAPPISILGQTTTGNALQYTTTWAPALDTALLTQQGVPFIVEGTGGGTVDVPWLSEDPISGSLGAGACEMVDVTFDSTLLAAGLYEASLDVSSNDPDEPVINLPVSMLVVEPAIELAKTVGTDSSVCATTDEITVDEGTTVYYCYTVTNTGDVMLDVHDLEDNILGPILIDFPFDLMPGASAWITASAVVNADVTNIGTWTASAGAFSVEASDTATVNVIIEPDVYWYYLPINFKNYP